MGDLLRALGLLTTLPFRPHWDEGSRPGRAMAYYPLVGALIGALLALLAAVLTTSGTAARAPFLGAALVLAAWAGLTGALHLDGWADCCDGLLVPVERAKRFEIMKDPRLGSFGGVGLVLLLLAKAGALVALLPFPPVLVITPVLARWTLVVAAKTTPLAKQEGMAFFFRQSLGWREVALATVLAAGFGVLAWLSVGPRVLVLAAAAVLATWAVAGLAVRRLGGVTGDVYGAMVEFTETVVLVAAVLTLP